MTHKHFIGEHGFIATEHLWTGEAPMRIQTQDEQGPSEVRQAVLHYLKQHGPSTIAEIAEYLSITYEGIRQHLVALEKQAWIERHTLRERSGAGRPLQRYSLTAAGDHLFPKEYDALTVELIDTISQNLGSEALRLVLAALTRERVHKWAPRMQGKNLQQRLQALRGVYMHNDPYMSLDETDGELRLIERNCPFLNVAGQRPALCSVTINTLRNLLGVQVVREKRFQTGDGCCVFKILPDKPLAEDEQEFRFEDTPV